MVKQPLSSLVVSSLVLASTMASTVTVVEASTVDFVVASTLVFFSGFETSFCYGF